MLNFYGIDTHYRGVNPLLQLGSGATLDLFNSPLENPAVKLVTKRLKDPRIQRARPGFTKKLIFEMKFIDDPYLHN